MTLAGEPPSDDEPGRKSFSGHPLRSDVLRSFSFFEGLEGGTCLSLTNSSPGNRINYK